MADVSEKPRVMRFDMTINVPTLMAIAGFVLSAYTMYLKEMQEIRSENIRQDGRVILFQSELAAVAAKVTKLEIDIASTKTDRDLLIRMDTAASAD